MRHLSTPLVLCGCALWIGLGCAKSDGFLGDGNGGSSATGGTSASGGDTGTGGSGTGTGGSGTGTGGIGTGAGGNVATGGRPGTGGGAGGKGGSGTGGSGSGGIATGGATGTGGTTAACSITPTASTSTKIPTVGIVTFTTTASSPTEAHINFGLDTTYGMTAPVSLTAASYRTLLLGMKASKTYHYQISVTTSSGTCTSGDNMIATGALPNGGLPQLTVTTSNKAALYGGFLVIGSYQGSTIQSFILDVDGDFVWWYADGSDGCGTRMSYDGNYMWINNGNVPATTGSTQVHRVTMDGLTDANFSTPFANMSHQVTPLPDGSVAFYASGSNGCDDIKLFPANGTTSSTATTVVNSRTAHGGTGACHVNNIEYSQTDDTLVFSDLDNDCLTKVSRTTGATVWVLNGNTMGITSTFTGDLWNGGEHGFHILSTTDILLFNNNSSSSGGTGPAMALELTLDTTAKTSTKKWSYTSNPTHSVMVLGDVQRMTTNGPNGSGNGNTIVDFGTGDVVQEVSSSGTVLQQISSQSPFGFMEKRATLYGAPTR
jgi:hypothetical protein